MMPSNIGHIRWRPASWIKKVLFVVIMFFFLWVLIKLFIYGEILTYTTCGEYTEKAKNVSHMESLSQLINVTLNDNKLPNNAIDILKDKSIYYIESGYVDPDRYARFRDKSETNFLNLVLISDKNESSKLNKIGIYWMRQMILFDAYYDNDAEMYLSNPNKVEVVCNRWCVFGWCETRKQIVKS